MRFRLKPGMGKHHMRGRDGKRIVLRPGDTIDCDPLDLGGAIGKFNQLDPEPEPDPAAPTVDFTVVWRKGEEYDVVHVGSGEPINDEPLTAEEAADLAGIPLDQVPPPIEIETTTPPGGPSDDEA